MAQAVGQRAFLGGQEIIIGNSILGSSPVAFNVGFQDTFQWRNDPYSSSLVLAMPFSLFPTLGMSDYKQDVSALIKGSGTNVSLAVTGSDYFPSSSVATYSTASWAAEGYTNSGYAGRNTLYGAPSTTTVNFSTSNFVIECYVLIPPGSVSANFNSTVFGHNSGDYLLSDFSTFGNSVRFYINGSGTPQSSPWGADQWYHIAWVRSGNNFYSYVNGARKHNFTVSGAVSNSPDGFWRLLGYADFNSTVPKTTQDFRLYIGTDKGYTGATITPPMPMVQKT